MFLLRQPADAQIHDYLQRQAAESFSYETVGCTRQSPQPRPGWCIDRRRVQLGRGMQVFHQARKALEGWRMFPPEMTTLCWPAPPHEGQTVAVLYRAAPLRLWLLFAARVVYMLHGTIDRGGSEVERFGFAYGTLPDHPERGEERFAVEWNRRDDTVWYDLLAVSRPRHWLARLGYPYTRYEQARFRRLSGAAMQRAVIMER